MPGKTKIDGTSYDVSKGRALSGGTGYDIQSGRTRVDGTGYDVSFIRTFIVTITGKGNSSGTSGNQYYARVGGVVYTSAVTLEVPEGTEIYCYARHGTNTSGNSSKVIVNGTVVAQNSNFYAPAATYTFYTNSDVEIALTSQGAGCSVAVTTHEST